MGNTQIHRHEGAQDGGDTITMLWSPATSQYTGFKLRTKKSMCGQKCHVTQIPEVALCVLIDNQSEGNFTFRKDVGTRLESTQLLSWLGFLHLDTNQQMQDWFTQAQGDLCQAPDLGRDQ